MMLLSLQEDTKRLSEIPRVLRPRAFACSFHSTRKSSTTASPPLRMTDRGLSCETWSRRIESKPRYSRFFFCPCRPKRKSLAKRKRPRSDFALCGARPRLRALDGRHLAVGLQSADARRVAILCGGRALARDNTPFICLRAVARCVAALFIAFFSFTRARARVCARA